MNYFSIVFQSTIYSLIILRQIQFLIIGYKIINKIDYPFSNRIIYLIVLFILCFPITLFSVFNVLKSLFFSFFTGIFLLLVLMYRNLSSSIFIDFEDVSDRVIEDLKLTEKNDKLLLC